MRIIEEYMENINISENLVIALGNFDGIHRGHRKLIEQAVAIAKEKNIKSAVFTFDIHPLRILRPEANIEIITNNYTKAKILEELGVDYLFLIKFNTNLAQMDEKKFLENLKKRFSCEVAVCGYNYTYGRDGNGNIKSLISNSKELGFELAIVDKVSYNGQDISSSLIRHKIKAGNIKEANLMLGYNYFIYGKVIKGKRLGRNLGFPTANIEIIDNLCLRNGVYISTINFDNRAYYGVSNIGRNPTVGDKKRMLETHIFNFNEDIYEKEICVELLEFIRSETKFNSVEELKERVFKDIAAAKAYFKNNDIYNPF